jgi:hypothetical protein
MKLYMTMLGCKPEGRFTGQHDIFFGLVIKRIDSANGSFLAGSQRKTTY